jgi:predicted ATPase/DNA-binding SARP family transcriptional activator
MDDRPTGPAGPSHLPVQLTAFIGREREIETLNQLLAGLRLLTLTGAGGSGKTRLALEVARHAAPGYPDGVAWVELASLADGELVAQQVAATLGVREDPGRSATENLIAFLQTRSLLLVLDNCEHLTEACATLADVVLRECPGTRILATSREALGVGGERAWLVPALTTPDAGADPSTLAGFEAVRLFLERAQDAVAHFMLTQQNAAVVAGICRRLDGIPLAIELAAARVRVLTPGQILDRLDNAFSLLTSGSRTALPRHRTLRATIDWSYRLLTESEQALLQKLSVFAGGFTLEAVEAVCADDDLEPWEVLDLVARLVDRSLVVVREQGDAARYQLLDTVRQYACNHLQERGAQDAVQRRHAEYFLGLVRAAEPHVILFRRPWIERVDIELDNFRSAISWSHATGNDAQFGLPLTAGLIWYWYHRLLWREGLRLLEAALTGAPDADATERARALHGTGVFALYVGDLELAEQGLRAAERIWRETGNDRWLAFTLSCLTTIELTHGRPDAAEARAEECLRVARSVGDPWDFALASGYPAMAVRMWRKDWAGADLHLAEAERIFRDCDYAFGLSFVLDARAFLALQRGDLEHAEALARLVLRELATRRDEWVASRSLRVLAVVAVQRADFHRAVVLFAASDALLSSVGARSLTGERGSADAAVDHARSSLSDDVFASAWAEGAAMDFSHAMAYALPAVGTGADTANVAPVVKPVPANPSAAAVSPARISATASAAAPAALRVRALGSLEIEVDGQRLSDDAWPYARPKELLVYFLFHPQGRTREQIGVVFWPGSTAAQVKNSFHVTLHHLRKVLGSSDWVVLENDRYRINPGLSVDFDAARFDAQVTQSLRQVKAGAGPMDQLRSALTLYRGDLLEHDAARDWHLEHRGHLQRLYCDGLSALGELLMQAGDHATAAHTCLQVLAKDNLREETHRRLIRCLSLGGERARALRHYEQLVTLLREEVDTRPDAETTALYEELKQSTAGSQPELQP